ncbi:MAG: hypothetical protein PHZ28_03895 [Candidatus Izemoplasmatales bacterium]|nr:hypothetical protein [Candidatus Izemoplasmatales bacterium]
METLFKRLEMTLNDENSYYYNKYFDYLGLKDLVANNSIATNFIMEYFYTGGKASLFANQQELTRVKHVIMSYLLGVMILENTNLKQKFHNYLKKTLNLTENFIDDKNDNALYFWYLTSLFHDFGYIYENKLTTMGLEDNERSDIFMNSTSVNGQVYNFRMNTNRFPVNTYHKYYLYAFKNLKIHEHGFLGGNMMFNRMKENLVQKMKSESLIGKTLSVKPFISEGLHWSINHLDIYRMLSFVVMEHNIWRLDDESLAREYGLDNLLGDNYKRIDPENETLLFLLSLVDAMEPFKKFDNEIGKKSLNFEVFLNFLRNTRIEFEENKIKISNFTQDILFKEMENSVRDIKKWMNVEYKKGSYSFEISW